MRIGISAPIEINSLKDHLENLNEFHLSLGLGGTAVNLIIIGLLRQGHSVVVFTLDPKIEKKLILKGPKLKIIIGHFRAHSKLKWFDFCRHEYKQIQYIIKQEKENIDIVNAHWSYEFAIGTILAKVPHMITFRDHALTILRLNQYHPYRFFRLLMDYWVRKNGGHFSYNSIYLQEKIKISGVVIPNPVKDDNIKNARKYPHEKKIIDLCFIANGWGHLKNPENAIQGFYKAQDEIKNIRLNLIGSGYEYNAEYLQEYLSDKHGRSIVCWGKLAHNELIDKLSSFDILLHTSREESFGNNIIEAMASGMPVIAGKNSGAVPWVLEEGKSGVLVDIENPNDIADAIIKVILDPEKYENLSKRGIANVKRRFTIETVAQQYINSYKKVINGN
jgi:glycosyltransferase involved in cell wall biosynthesis